MTNAIETRALSRHFGTFAAVEALTLTIPTGSVFGFLGPNGAGKTTTVRMLTGLIAPTAGEALVAGYRLGQDDTAIRRTVGLLTETPGLYDRLSPLDNLRFVGRLYGLRDDLIARQCEHYLRLFGLWERRNEPIGGFSKGMRQKIAIARALLHEPKIIFLDEPTSGLDPEAARIVRDVVKELRSAGRTIFLTTHNLAEAEDLCDMIGIFRGRLIRVDTQQSLRDALFGRGAVIHFAGPAEPWQGVARALPFVRAVAVDVADARDTIQSALTVTLDDPDEQNPALIRALIGAGASVRYVEPLRRSLEEAYLALLNGHDPDAPTGRVGEMLRIAGGHTG
jgi:ABC-2 type transport system ATP-binding protein